jgi:hypothetical protein
VRRVAATIGIAALVSFGRATAARADAPPPSTQRAGVYSPYERQAIDDALARLHETLDPSPEGKIVEGIDVVTLDVIDERDPAPQFVNVFHATTRRRVVDREILVRPGERYDPVAVDESVRNLRIKPQLSLVVAVPVVGSEPDRVRLLVITKDVWSLRLNSNIQVSPGGIEDLVLQPSEINFLGTHQSAALYFELDPASITLGASYTAPRLGGTRSVLGATANVITNRATGALEGSYGQLLGYQPLFSAKTEWAWDSLVSWDQEIARRFVNAKEATYQGVVPWEYAIRRYVAEESVTRSFGWATKHDFSLGAQVDLRRYSTGSLTGYDPALVQRFVGQAVPRSDDRVGPFLQYHGYESSFVRLLDFQTLGLQEDYRLGPEVYVRVYPLAKALGSSRDVLGLYASAEYTFTYLGDGIVRAQIESTTEAETSRLSDAAVAGGAEIVTPQLGFGRFVYDAHALSRYRNYLNQETFLGGNTRLRGYPTNFFVGKDVAESNFELRTAPITVLKTLEIGAAAFYDAASAFDGFDNLHLYQSVGVGWRSLFPQLDRYVFRVDFGFPVGDGARIPGVAPMSFFIAFEQAVPFPSLASAALPSGAQ